jgi:hypothetical protein
VRKIDMYRSPLMLSIVLAGFAATTLAAAAATLEYTFTVPYDVKAPVTGSAATGAGAGRISGLNVTCAVGPASLSYSTATNAAVGATGSGTTNNVTRSPATVVVTVDAEPKAVGPLAKEGAGGLLQPVKAGGYYTCWGTFPSGVTPVNFLPTTALPKPKV